MTLLTAGEIGRLSTAASLASNDILLVYQNGILKKTTPNQVASNAGTVAGSFTVAGTIASNSQALTPAGNTIASTASNIPNSGFTSVGSSVSNTFAMTTPVANTFKWLSFNTGTAVQVVSCSGANVGTTSATKLTFAGAGDGVSLYADSNTHWSIVGKTTGVTLS